MYDVYQDLDLRKRFWLVAFRAISSKKGTIILLITGIEAYSLDYNR